MTLDADVIVVGAGPAGSAAAIELARRGVRVTLVDRARFPRDKPCGDYCNPGAVRALAELGCLERVAAAGASPIAGMTVYAPGGAAFATAFPTGPLNHSLRSGSGQGGLLIPRRRMDAALVAQADRAGAAIVERFAVTEARVAGDAVEVRATDRAARLRARLLIAADGMRSSVARQFGLYAPVTSGRYTVGAYFVGLPHARPRGELHLGPDVYCGVAHFGSGEANVCMALPRYRWQRCTPEQAFAAGLATLPVLAGALSHARRASPFRCAGPVGFASRRTAADRVLLAGDAAGQIEPMTGQGIWLALTSGRLAARHAEAALTANALSAAALRGYDRAYRRSVAGTRLIARWLQRLAFRPGLTSMLVHRLDAAPALATRLLGVTGDVLPPGAVLSPAYIVGLLLVFGRRGPQQGFESVEERAAPSPTPLPTGEGMDEASGLPH